MMPTTTNEHFIKKAKVKHGNKFEYEKKNKIY